MALKRKKRILKIIRKSVLTGKAVWLSHERSYVAEWKAYKRACQREAIRIRWWGSVVKRRRKNIMQLLSNLTAGRSCSGDISEEKRDAAKFLAKMADTEPVRDDAFYDHIREESRQRRNARKREKRRQQKHGNDSA